mmetsp:Transcript_20241/g.55887  ORF Transcript_20241/g.55887 Transcript_20241/m.55887 type:complete len:100 (+) Transcript_20241:112-411(+)
MRLVPSSTVRSFVKGDVADLEKIERRVVTVVVVVVLEFAMGHKSFRQQSAVFDQEYKQKVEPLPDTHILQNTTDPFGSTLGIVVFVALLCQRYAVSKNK